MVSEGRGASKAAPAHRARVGLHRAVDGEMVAEVVLVGERLAADVTRERLVFYVRFPVCLETR